VEISASGSGEGPRWATASGYSTDGYSLRPASGRPVPPGRLNFVVSAGMKGGQTPKRPGAYTYDPVEGERA